ncbi:hypothetical protein Q5N85_20030, partial [Acinetobacter baumannii]|nr:hypothetical protein [Acinetobacter baumannii]
VEDWGGRAKSCAYLVGSLLDQQQEDTREAVEHAAQDWLQWNLSHLMPGAMVGDQVDWRRFVDPQNGEGPARLRAQYS